MASRILFAAFSLEEPHSANVQTFWPHNVPVGDGQDPVMRSDDQDVDADDTILIVLERMTCNLQNSVKGRRVPAQMESVPYRNLGTSGCTVSWQEMCMRKSDRHFL